MGISSSDFLYAFMQPDCPVCWFAGQAEKPYLLDLITHKLNSHNMRYQIRDGLGFCYRHSKFLIENDLVDSFDLALLYHDILLNTFLSLSSNRLSQSPSGKRPSWVNRFFHKKIPRTTLLLSKKQCPACVEKLRLSDLFIQSLSETVYDEALTV